VAVALLPPEPGAGALSMPPAEAAGRALDALLPPWPYPMLARRLPRRWGEALSAWLVDRERDPILRFAAIARMGGRSDFSMLSAASRSTAGRRERSTSPVRSALRR
jgi:hypothetical protein